MFGIDDILMLATAGGSLLGGLFGSDNSNQLSGYGDPNNPMYKAMQQQYFNNLSNTLNASSPGTQDLLRLSMARGGDFGGSNYIANKQREDIMRKNNEAAGNASSQFLGNLYGQGMNLAAQGQLQSQQYRNSFSNNLIGLGGGLLSRYFSNNSSNPNDILGGNAGNMGSSLSLGNGYNPNYNMNNGQVLPPNFGIY